MTHFDEMACLLYLEGQLDPSRTQELATHIDECPQCRDLLRVLERESHVLAAAFTEDSEPMPARLVGARRRNIPSWAFAFGVFAAGAYWLWTDGISPWLDQLSNAGFGGTDLMSMILFSGAFWEGWGDMIDILQIAFLIVVVLGALVLVRRRLRRTTAIAVVVSTLLLAMALPQPAAAADVRRGRSIFVPAGETVHNDLIATGASVRIDGTVEGDLIVFTRNLNVTGHVTGDIIAFAAETLIDGTVDGNLRAISRDATVQGTIGKNISFVGNSIDLSPRADLAGELIAIATEANLGGKIHRDLLGIIGATNLDGLIGGQAWIRGGTLTVESAADIRGPVTFAGRSEPIVASGAKLASPVKLEITQEVRRFRRSTARTVIDQFFSYGVALLVGILLVTAFPGFFCATLRETGSIGLPLGVGALALITGVFLLILGIVLLFVGVGAGIVGVMAYAPILYMAQIFVGAWLGNKILGNPSSAAGVAIGRIALGLLILHVAAIIPILGGLVWFAVLLWGTGAVLLGFFRISRVEPAALQA